MSAFLTFGEFGFPGLAQSSEALVTAISTSASLLTSSFLTVL
jgi:hypothetical protein